MTRGSVEAKKREYKTFSPALPRIRFVRVPARGCSLPWFWFLASTLSHELITLGDEEEAKEEREKGCKRRALLL